MHETRCYLGYIVFLMVFQCLIKPGHPHLQHRNICSGNCVAGISCVLRGLTQRCGHLNLDRQRTVGIRNRHSLVPEQFVYPRSWIMGRRPVANGEITPPSQDIVNPSQHTAEQQTSDTRRRSNFERKHQERRLYSSRIGQALNYTFHNQVGRGAVVGEIPRESVEIIQNFASNGRLHIRDRPSVRRGLDDVPKVTEGQTTPSVRQTFTQGDGTICTACDENADCPEGNYCYHSPTCGIMICQSLK